MTNKRKKNIRELAADLGIRRRAAASRLDASRSEPTDPGARARESGAAYAGPRGEAAPPVPLREALPRPARRGERADVRRRFRAGGGRSSTPLRGGAPADLVRGCRSAHYVEAMDKNNWATEARYALAQIARDVGTAYAESVRKGTPALCASTAPTPPMVPAPGERVQAIDQFRSDPGWRGILFSMDHPVCFQYRIEAGDLAFPASARGRRRETDGRTADVSLILRGRLDDAGALWTSAIEEAWTVSGAGA